MLKTIPVRPAVVEDIPQLVNLMNSQYSRKKRESYFRWQYFESFYPTISMCAFIDNKLVGMFGLQERRLKNGAYVGQAIDLLVNPMWRKKGIFKLLGEKAFEYFKNLDLLCVFPNLSGKNACERAFGWKTLCKINSMRLKRNITEETLKATKSLRSKRILYDYFECNNAYRNWRFDQNPEYQYVFVKLKTGEFAITKIFKDPVTRIHFGDIVDFECELNNQERLRELMIKATVYLREQKVNIVTTWALPYSPLHETVEMMGFVEMPQERYLCVKVLNPKYEYLYHLSNWHIVQADCEIY